MEALPVSLLLGLAVLLLGPTVSTVHVILEFPKPMIAGTDATLRCKTTDGSTHIGYFFRNGSFIGAGLTGEFTISDVQQSDEGLYWCSTGLLSVSSKSWLSVRDPPAPSLSVVRLLCHLVAACPYFISTVLMASICCSKRIGNKSAVSMVMDTRGDVVRGHAEEDDYVTTEHHF